jgi:hypothetical protein
LVIPNGFVFLADVFVFSICLSKPVGCSRSRGRPLLRVGSSRKHRG